VIIRFMILALFCGEPSSSRSLLLTSALYFYKMLCTCTDTNESYNCKICHLVILFRCRCAVAFTAVAAARTSPPNLGFSTYIGTRER
jgi:hypothetical protein